MHEVRTDEDAKNRLIEAIVDRMVPYEIQLKLHRCERLTYDEATVLAEANSVLEEFQNLFSRQPRQGTLATDESLESILLQLERRLKTHITSRTRLPRKVIDYFAENIELDECLLGGDDARDVRVTGVKLQMREIACRLIDDYDALPVKAADAVFEHFAEKPEAYDNRLSFRTTVYKHYEITRGCKPEIKANSIRDMKELGRIIPILL